MATPSPAVLELARTFGIREDEPERWRFLKDEDHAIDEQVRSSALERSFLLSFIVTDGVLPLPLFLLNQRVAVGHAPVSLLVDPALSYLLSLASTSLLTL